MARKGGKKKSGRQTQKKKQHNGNNVTQNNIPSTSQINSQESPQNFEQNNSENMQSQDILLNEHPVEHQIITQHETGPVANENLGVLNEKGITCTIKDCKLEILGSESVEKMTEEEVNSLDLLVNSNIKTTIQDSPINLLNDKNSITEAIIVMESTNSNNSIISPTLPSSIDSSQVIPQSSEETELLSKDPLNLIGNSQDYAADCKYIVTPSKDTVDSNAILERPKDEYTNFELETVITPFDEKSDSKGEMGGGKTSAEAIISSLNLENDPINSGISRQETLYIVHLSDIHIFPPSKHISVDTEDPHTIKRFQGMLNVKYGRGVGDFRKLEGVKTAVEKSFSLDKCHFIVTGDLTNVSLRAEFDYCHRELKRLFQKNDNLTVIPGNHDMYVETARERFVQYYHSLCWKGNEEHTFPFVKVIPNGTDNSLIMIGFNSGVPTKLFIASGVVGEDQINKARTLLKEIFDREKNKKHMLCVLIHHPPARRYNKFIEWMGMLDERSKRRVQAFCKEFGVHLILNGHTHEPHVSVLQDSDTLSIDCGSTTMNSPKEKTSFFNVYQITGTRMTRAWQYVWNNNEFCFKDTKLTLPSCRLTQNPLENSNSSFYSTEADSENDDDPDGSHSPFAMLQSTSIKMEAQTY